MEPLEHLTEFLKEYGLKVTKTKNCKRNTGISPEATLLNLFQENSVYLRQHVSGGLGDLVNQALNQIGDINKKLEKLQ